MSMHFKQHTIFEIVFATVMVFEGFIILLGIPTCPQLGTTQLSCQAQRRDEERTQGSAFALGWIRSGDILYFSKKSHPMPFSTFPRFLVS